MNTIRARFERQPKAVKLRLFREVQDETELARVRGEFKRPGDLYAFMNNALDRKLKEIGQ